LLVLAAFVTACGSTSPHGRLIPPGRLTFDATFDRHTITPFAAVQCANTGTRSKPPRYRGSFSFQTSNPGDGAASAQIVDPKTPSGYQLTACNLLGPAVPLGIGTTSYYGLMVYVPKRFTVANHFFGQEVEIEEFKFDNIWGAPVSWELHSDHVTLSLQTGACNNYKTAAPGCAYHSNADAPEGVGNLPPLYVVPPGKLAQGQWNELAMGVNWESTSTGSIRTYYKAKGASHWNAGSSISGIPTVQYDRAKGCCQPTAVEETEAYAGALSAPLTISLDNDVEGTSLRSVENAMP
jgi:Polysaccharide lyase